MQFTNYEGPGSFGTMLLHACQNRAMQIVVMHTRATYYPEFNIVIQHNPKAIRALLKRLNHLLQLNLDISDIDREAADLETKLESISSQNSEFRAYVEKLEEEYIDVKYEEPLEISPDEAVNIAEELLRGEEGD